MKKGKEKRDSKSKIKGENKGANVIKIVSR